MAAKKMTKAGFGHVTYVDLRGTLSAEPSFPHLTARR
jgi:hypothetical protein